MHDMKFRDRKPSVIRHRKITKSDLMFLNLRVFQKLNFPSRTYLKHVK
jgi:hypothetical protein